MKKEFAIIQVQKEYAWTAWKVEDILLLSTLLVENKKKILVTIHAIPKKERTFENTIVALERSDEMISDAFSHLEILLNASPDKKIRDACAESITKLSDLTTDLVYDENTYKAITEYTTHGDAPTSTADIKLLTELITSYRRLGFELPKAKRRAVQTLFKTLQHTSQTFSRNINEWRGSISVHKAELAGTPEVYQHSLSRDGEMYIITTDYPSMNPFMTFAKSETRRKELWEIVQQKGGKKNINVLTKMSTLRTKIATLLGYTSWARYQLETYLVQSPKKARTTISQVLTGTRKQKNNDLVALKKLKKLDSKNSIQPWDIAYYDNLLRIQKYSVDENELREHLPLTHVLATLFSIYEKILGITFTKNNRMPTWHPDVFRYDLSDTKSKEVLGYIFLDLYPREGKYGHAAAFQTSDSRKDDLTGLQQPTAVTLMCNFAKPLKSSLSLLSRDDVETLFHEFGHALHHLLSKVSYASQGGFKTKLDFVEAPSQLLEHWCWDAAILKKLTRHYVTGKSLAPKKIQALINSQYHMQGYFWTRQMVQSLLSLDIHELTIKDMRDHYRNLVKKHFGFTLSPNSLFPAGFGHLSEYASAYYVYVYSKVYCDDFASLFKKNGMANKRIGMRYRKEILEYGASRDEDESSKAFLGREVSTEAFLKELQGK